MGCTLLSSSSPELSFLTPLVLFLFLDTFLGSSCRARSLPLGDDEGASSLMVVLVVDSFLPLPAPLNGFLSGGGDGFGIILSLKSSSESTSRAMGV